MGGHSNTFALSHEAWTTPDTIPLYFQLQPFNAHYSVWDLEIYNSRWLKYGFTSTLCLYKLRLCWTNFMSLYIQPSFLKRKGPKTELTFFIDPSSKKTMQATRSPETRELSIFWQRLWKKSWDRAWIYSSGGLQAAASANSFYAHALSAPVPFVPLPTIYSKI